MTALMHAAELGDTAGIRDQLRAGADIEARVKGYSSARQLIAFISWMQQLPERHPGWTPLMFAVSKGHVDAAWLLLQHGANASVVAAGFSALDLALVSPRPRELLRLLIEHGASLTAGRSHARPLVLAAENGDTALIKFLLQRGAQVNAADQSTITPLIAAARNGRTEAVKLLIAAGADQNARDNNGWSAARFALENGHAEVAALLASSKAAQSDARDHALFEAIAAANLERTLAALATGANPNARGEHGRAAVLQASGQSEGVTLALLEAGAVVDSTVDQALMYSAVVSGWEKLFDRLIAHGIEPSDDLIVEAARMGRVHMVDRMLVRGVDLNLMAGEPLRTAAKHGQLEVAQFLLAKAARFDLEDRFGITAFDEACGRGRTEIARLFLEAGADPNRKRRGQPVLIDAVWTGNPDLVRLLLEAGAKPEATDTAGKTALDHASRLRIERVIAVLERELE
ncbi:MAG: ankyrin repeat domain-containing protein [Gemmatimonadota bacterium]